MNNLEGTQIHRGCKVAYIGVERLQRNRGACKTSIGLINLIPFDTLYKPDGLYRKDMQAPSKIEGLWG